MANSPRRIYWDSCSWIALIQNETIVQDGVTIEKRAALCRNVISDASKGDAEIFTSALSLIEVSKGSDRTGGIKNDRLKDFFENDYIVLVDVDRQVGELGRDLMQRGYSKLKPADASHLAAAAIACVDEMHTFDDKLLALNGIIDRPDGAKLRICKPAMGGPGMPLFERKPNEIA